MTTRKRSTRAARKSHEEPAAIEIKRPKDEPMLTVTPAVGPNEDGITHQIAAAHTIDEEALAARRNHIAPPDDESEQATPTTEE